MVFVNFNAGDDWLVRLAGDDPTWRRTSRRWPGSASPAWRDDDWTHAVLRLTTD